MSHFDLSGRWRMIGNIDLSPRNYDLISYIPLNAEVKIFCLILVIMWVIECLQSQRRLRHLWSHWHHAESSFIGGFSPIIFWLPISKNSPIGGAFGESWESVREKEKLLMSKITTDIFRVYLFHEVDDKLYTRSVLIFLAFLHQCKYYGRVTDFLTFMCDLGVGGPVLQSFINRCLFNNFPNHFNFIKPLRSWICSHSFSRITGVGPVFFSSQAPGD